MADPIEFNRRLANGDVQRCGNRVQIEDENASAISAANPLDVSVAAVPGLADPLPVTLETAAGVAIGTLANPLRIDPIGTTDQPVILETATAVPGVAGDVNAPAVNTAAVITYAAAVGVVHVISGVAWSYNDDPTGGNLQIADGAAVIFNIDITTSGPGFIPFPFPKSGTAGQAMVITLAAAGAAVAGKVDALNHWTV